MMLYDFYEHLNPSLLLRSAKVRPFAAEITAKRDVMLYTKYINYSSTVS